MALRVPAFYQGLVAQLWPRAVSAPRRAPVFTAAFVVLNIARRRGYRDAVYTTALAARPAFPVYWHSARGDSVRLRSESRRFGVSVQISLEEPSRCIEYLRITSYLISALKPAGELSSWAVRLLTATIESPAVSCIGPNPTGFHRSNANRRKFIGQHTQPSA